MKMKKTTVHAIVAVCAIITFLIPLIQLAIGFNNVVKDGQDANSKCRAAPDLPLLLAIGGIFALFFLGTAYGLLKMISSIDQTQSDIAGKMPKILIGLISFIFGAITFIFFILIQIRVYGSYSNTVNFDNKSASNYCKAIIMRGGLVMIILTYINILLFTTIFVLILLKTRVKRQEQKQIDMEMVETRTYHRL